MHINDSAAATKHEARQCHEADKRLTGLENEIKGIDLPDWRAAVAAADMASWAGKPSIKGSTESMRMALLTFSLAGLQYVSWTSTTGVNFTDLVA